MAIQNKSSWAGLRVGLMALVALLIVGALVFLITGQTSLFKSKGTLLTYLNDSAALTEASPVRLNGIYIGNVKSVALSGENALNRVVKVELEVQEKWFSAIPVDSKAAIASENVLGSKYININKGKAAQTVQNGSVLASLDVSEFEDVVQRGYDMLGSLQGIIKKVDGIVAQVELGKGSIGKLLVDEELYNRLVTITGDVEQLTKGLNRGEGTIGKLLKDDKLYGDVRGTVSRLDVLVQGLQDGQGTAGKLLKDPALYDDLRGTVKDVRFLLAGLERGEGTAGKLLKSTELHDQMNRTIAKLDLMLDKLNQGQGTLGQLLVNQQLYENLNGATHEMHGLMKDFRTNPKKFLRIQLKLF